MHQIRLTNGKITLIDKAFSWLSQWKWTEQGGYAYRRVGNSRNKTIKGIFMHREILKVPKGKFTDHINGNKLDNRVKNLRIVTKSQNGANVAKRKHSLNSYKGIHYLKFGKRQKRWEARITIKRKVHSIGRYLTQKQAAKAYDQRAKELFGEFAQLNFK